MFFQIAAVLILLIFYGCYFGKMLIQKKKGIQTNQIGKGKAGFVKIIELTMKAATILADSRSVQHFYESFDVSDMGKVCRHCDSCFGRRYICDFRADDERQLARGRF